MKPLTGNQKVALYILGYLPKGWILVTKKCNCKSSYRVGEIYIDGKSFASIPSTLHGGDLPRSINL